MFKSEIIEILGTVKKIHRGTIFRVNLDNGYQIIAHISGKMRKNKIRIIVGDKVKVEMSRYDLTKGRIMQRIRL